MAVQPKPALSRLAAACAGMAVLVLWAPLGEVGAAEAQARIAAAAVPLAFGLLEARHTLTDDVTRLPRWTLWLSSASLLWPIFMRFAVDWSWPAAGGAEVATRWSVTLSLGGAALALMVQSNRRVLGWLRRTLDIRTVTK